MYRLVFPSTHLRKCYSTYICTVNCWTFAPAHTNQGCELVRGEKGEEDVSVWTYA